MVFRHRLFKLDGNSSRMDNYFDESGKKKIKFIDKRTIQSNGVDDVLIKGKQ